jgi:hypothetical protein
MIIIYSLSSLLMGVLIGLLWSIRTFPKREVNRLYSEFKNVENKRYGQWKHFRNKVDHNLKIIVKPNCETLYSTTFIDLKSGGFKLTVPSSELYFSACFLNENTDVIKTITNEHLNVSDNTTLLFSTDKNDEANFIPSGLLWLIIRFGIPADGSIEKVHQQQNELLIERINVN